jgi:multiple RNA-binding domain-containing protein 1
VNDDSTIQVSLAEGDARLGKRKRDSIQQVHGDAKLQEYLHVMQPPSKLKIWSNEDLKSPQEAAQPQDTVGEQHDGDYETDPKKSKKAVRLDKAVEALYSSEGKSTVLGARESPSDVTLEGPSPSLDQQRSATSDGDWLRSRTSNRFNLNGMEDVTPLKASLGTDHLISQETITSRQLLGEVASDVGVQAEGKPDSRISTQAPGSENATGRLFVRNLTYAITEDELREYFASHGTDSIQEVRSIRCFLSLGFI